MSRKTVLVSRRKYLVPRMKLVKSVQGFARWCTWTNSRYFAAQIAPSWPPNEVKHLGSTLVFLVEILSRPSNNLKKHRAHCLKAMPGYWYKIAKHCKQILLPEIVKVFTRTWKESNVAGTFQSISSRSLTRADENGSGNIEISLGYRRRGRVSSSLGSYKTDNPK